ncbi:NCS2 family permease [Stratiformator vulcanicus]|uniref:Permease n=1 Tax=Stratiformator vulcanicus TaxID=2527980 RepID=A0A517R1R5_9PLAN|nr:NCS2 family permease [Stratiformator vulcanicus]QDT37801.1 hypothetical protein Pan189_21830 [Stratiformator vulcanicus]
MKRNPLFCRGDLDGFFGLFVDNLVQFLTIINLWPLACGIFPGSPEYAELQSLMLRYVFPGAAVSLLIGNVFYAWQAHRVSQREGRDDVTALPYGINTPSLLVYIFFVIGPAYQGAIAAEMPVDEAVKLSWMLGIIACLGSGLIEFFGSFVAGTIRSLTPRAALLSTLAGIAVGFISMTFALQIFQRPLVAMLPTAVILVTYFAGVKFPLSLPGGFLAVMLGTLCAWFLVPLIPEVVSGPAMSFEAVEKGASLAGLYLPTFVGTEIAEFLAQPSQWVKYLSVIVPMGLFNVVGSLQNVESAEAAGDRYNTGLSLGVNGFGTILAALFGSCFPTTIYIGHPGWKGLGARSGYSTLNGLVVTVICLTGTISLIAALIPLEAGVAIVLWIGVIITAQAYQSTPDEHAPAVAIGLFPAIAAFGFTVTSGAFIVCGFGSNGAAPTLQGLLGDAPVLSGQTAQVNGFLLHGMIALERGYIFTCMILAAISVFLIERKFMTAAIWSLLAAVLTGLGFMHAYQVVGNTVDYLFAGVGPANDATAFRAFDIAIGYLLFAILFAVMGWWAESSEKSAETATEDRPGPGTQ